MLTAIFDMDGTLINSQNAICEAVNEIREDLNLGRLAHSEITRIVNTPGIDWAKELYNIENFTHTSFKEGFERYFVKHYKQSVVLFDGLLRVLDFLKSRNCYLAIATNAPQASLVQVLEQHKILPYFDKVLGVSATMPPKPDPTMLCLIKDEAKHEKCVFVGDSKKDEEAAKNAKMPFFHAKWGQNLSSNSSQNSHKNAEFKAKFNEFTSFEFSNADELLALFEGFIQT